MDELLKLKCRLAKYASIYSGKLIWGIDCNIDLLQQEINTIFRYLNILDIYLTENSCVHIPQKTIKKIKSYVKDFSKNSSNFCKNC